LSVPLPRNANLPSQRSEAEKWQSSSRETLAELLRVRPYRASAQRSSMIELADLKVQFWRFQMRTDWTVPVVEIAPTSPKGTVIVIHDRGRRQAAEAATALLDNQQRVLAVDLFYFGESKIPSRDYLFALLVAAIGERPLGLQAAQLGAVARWARRQYPKNQVAIHAYGPSSSLIALAAAGLEEDEIQAVELHGSLGSVKEVIEGNWTVNQCPEMFCFGLLEVFDIPHLAALVAPRPVVFHEATERVRRELELLSGWYGLWGRDQQLVADGPGKKKGE
jgi:hypothetical protein